MGSAASDALLSAPPGRPPCRCGPHPFGAQLHDLGDAVFGDCRDDGGPRHVELAGWVDGRCNFRFYQASGLENRNMLDFFGPHDLGRQLHMLEPQQEEQVHFLIPSTNAFC